MASWRTQALSGNGYFELIHAVAAQLPLFRSLPSSAHHRTHPESCQSSTSLSVHCDCRSERVRLEGSVSPSSERTGWLHLDDRLQTCSKSHWTNDRPVDRTSPKRPLKNYYVQVVDENLEFQHCPIHLKSILVDGTRSFAITAGELANHRSGHGYMLRCDSPLLHRNGRCHMASHLVAPTVPIDCVPSPSVCTFVVYDAKDRWRRRELHSAVVSCSVVALPERSGNAGTLNCKALGH